MCPSIRKPPPSQLVIQDSERMEMQGGLRHQSWRLLTEAIMLLLCINLAMSGYSKHVIQWVLVFQNQDKRIYPGTFVAS